MKDPIKKTLSAAAIAVALAGCKSYEPLDRIDWAKEANATPPTVVISSLDDAATLALVGNRRLNAMRLKAKGADAVALQSGWWEDPEIDFDISRIIGPAENPFEGGGAFAVTVPLSGVPRLERKKAKAEAKSHRAHILAAEKLVAAEARKTALLLHFIAERKRIISEFANDASISKALADIEKLFLAHEYPFTDFNATKRRKHERDHMLMELEAAKIESERELRILTGLLPSANITVAIEPAAEPERAPDAPGAEDLAEHVAVKAALADLNVTEIELKKEIRKQYPNLKIGPGFGVEDGNEKVGAVAGMSIPLWNKNRRDIAQAETERAEKRAEAVSVWKEIAVDAQRAHKNLARLLEHRKAPAEENEEAKALLDSGEITPLEYVAIREEILAQRLEESTWHCEVALAAEELEKFKPERK